MKAAPFCNLPTTLHPFYPHVSALHLLSPPSQIWIFEVPKFGQRTSNPPMEIPNVQEVSNLNINTYAFSVLNLSSKKMAEKRSRWNGLGHGEYSEVPAEKDFFSIVKASDRVVCHFYRENWPCKVMDKHLSILAKQHIETRFVKINAEKSPFLAERLKIVVLPTLALIKNAKVDDYLVGFDELGGTDEFATEELEDRLAKAQVIFSDGESSFHASKSGKLNKRSVRQSYIVDSSDSD